MFRCRRIAPVGLIALVACGEPEPEPVRLCERDSAAHRVLGAWWAAVDRRYALFDLRLPGLDWAELGEQACTRLPEDASDDALFDGIIELARELDDGHVQLYAESLDRDEDGWVSAYPHLEAIAEVEQLVEAEYLDQPLSWAAQDWVAWGTIGEVGYLSLTSMEELSASGDEDDDRRAAREAMVQAMQILADTRGVVVDVRANEGGWDAVSLELATWFAGDRALAWSERRRDGPAHDDFGPWQEVWVAEAVPAAYGGPVVLLTSGGTFSAAETFALAMRVRDDVTVVGERSSGHLSDLLDGELPNGWEYTLSGERYRAADGEIYEVRGVPVDVAVAFDPQAMAQGRDPMLEAALERLP